MKTALGKYKLYFEKLPGEEELDARIKALNSQEQRKAKHELKTTVLAVATKIMSTLKFHIPRSKR